MTIFKKTFWIALAVQLAYWLLGAMVFQGGQPLLHFSTAVVAGLFLTIQLRDMLRAKARPRWVVWASLVAWPIFGWLCLQAILAWISFINWTLAEGIIPTTAVSYNIVRLLDMVLVSTLIALAVKCYQRWKGRPRALATHIKSPTPSGE